MNAEWIRQLSLLPGHAPVWCPAWLDNALVIAFVAYFVVLAWLTISAAKDGAA